VHASRGKLYRLIPRENPSVNKFWMCDAGRFEYKRVGANRLAVPRSGSTPVEWDRALADAARLLRATLDQDRGQVGVVFSAQSPNEDLYALARMAFDTLGVGRAYLAGLDQGFHDDILVSADKNPNTAGALAIGAGRLKSLLDLASDLKSGKLKGLLVVGEAGVLGENAGATMPLGKLDALVVAGWRHDDLVDQAHVALPMADWAEVDGTFTNRQGKVQRIRAAVAPAGDALPGWEILSLLSDRLGTPMEFAAGQGERGRAPSARSVFLEARQKMPFMKDADWGRVSLPVQLRFANSRG
jgi:NADH-quinone oxidoreductase subunit G